MQKLKPLLPTLREKKRYLVCEAIGKPTMPESEFNSTVIKGIIQFAGELGLSTVGLAFPKDKYKNNTGILRCSHTSVDVVKAALSLITDVNGTPVTFRTKGASGILKKVQKYYG